MSPYNLDAPDGELHVKPSEVPGLYDCEVTHRDGGHVEELLDLTTGQVQDVATRRNLRIVIDLASA